MNGRDFLRSARGLAAGPDEPDWRSGVSRNYHAAFHVARDLLAALQFWTPRADRTHNFLYDRLNNSGDPVAVDMASVVNDLRRLRNEFDYDVRMTPQAGDAADAVANADEVLRVIDALTPAAHTQITAAIKAYEQAVGDVTWQP
jgi:uncharacterized protein (UPF0332 family)